jgi:hypothetical protein
VGNSNTDVGTETATTRKPGQPHVAGTMSPQDSYVMGDNECAPQKLVRLVGCRDPKARHETRMRQVDVTKRQL